MGDGGFESSPSGGETVANLTSSIRVDPGRTARGGGANAGSPGSQKAGGGGGGNGRSPSWRVSSTFIRTGSTTGRGSCWTGRRAFSKAAVARAHVGERGVSKSVVLLTGDRGFESISLQRRVTNEPGSPILRPTEN